MRDWTVYKNQPKTRLPYPTLFILKIHVEKSSYIDYST